MKSIVLVVILGYLNIIGANELNTSNTTNSFWELYSSALRGDKIAQFQVGVLYERGKGIEQNQRQASQWYEKSALQGHVDAQYNIALMYATGRGIEKNERIAMMWFASAAKQGDQEARKLLLNMIDEKSEPQSKKEVLQSVNVAASNTSDITTVVKITPITLIAKAGTVVCDARNQCVPYKIKTVFTSTMKRGNQYKVSGIATKKGWQSYNKEGWVNENFCDIR
jgi:hypothetical protein